MCEGCNIEVRKALTLGTVDDSHLAGAWSTVVRNGPGQYFVATIAGPGSDHIRHYSPDGRLMRRIGRNGQVLGEFRDIMHITVGPADSIYVFDRARLSVLTPDGRFARMINLPFITEKAVVSPEGDVFLAAQNRSPELVGLPVHRLSREGVYLGSFGADRAESDWRRPSLSMRNLALSQDGSLWLIRPDLYRLEQWTTEGKHRRTLSRNADWFPTRDVELYDDNEPTPFVVGLRTVGSGRVWVLSVRADAKWDHQRASSGERRRYSPAKMDGMFDSMLELIDPTSGSLLASLRLPFYAGGFVDETSIWSLRETEAGAWLIDVWNLHLK